MADFTTDIDSDFIGQNSTASGDGSYALVKVPSHGTDTFYFNGTTSVTMTSFLRIGAVPSDDPTTEYGWDLAKLVVAFMDDTRTRDVDTDTASASITGLLADTTSSQSIDSDIQSRMSAFYGSGNATADQTKRIFESKKLHYRGGWRDHSDGNRITTTQGDKVEIIRGNYKMVVLGRQPTITDPVDSLTNSVTTWDASGGHIHDWRFTPGAVTEISWVQTDYGTWKVFEETVKGDVEETYHGAVTETYLGPSVTTQVGWDGGCVTDNNTVARSASDATDTSIPKIYRENPTLNRENPTITEQVWAKKILDYDGSSSCPVPYIEEITYADEIKEEIRVTSGTGKITTETHAKTYDEDIYVDYHVTTYHGVDARELWMGHFGETFLGACESFKIGNFLDMRVGGKIYEMNISVLPQTQVNISPLGMLTLELGLHKTDIYYGSRKNDFSFCTDIVTIDPGNKNEFSLLWKRLAVALFLG